MCSSIFLRERELILISSDVTAHARAFCGTRAQLSRPFPEKSSELQFQNFDGLKQENENEFSKNNVETVFYMPKSVK